MDDQFNRLPQGNTEAEPSPEELRSSLAHHLGTFIIDSSLGGGDTSFDHLEKSLVFIYKLLRICQNGSLIDPLLEIQKIIRAITSNKNEYNSDLLDKLDQLLDEVNAFDFTRFFEKEKKDPKNPEGKLRHFFNSAMEPLFYSLMSEEEGSKKTTLEFSKEQIEVCIRDIHEILTKLETGELQEMHGITKAKLAELINFIEGFDYKTKTLTLKEVRDIQVKFGELFPKREYLKFKKPQD